MEHEHRTIPNEDQPTPAPFDAPEHIVNTNGHRLKRADPRDTFWASDRAAEVALLGAILNGADPTIIDLAAWTIEGAQAVHAAALQLHDGKPLDLRLVQRAVGHELDRLTLTDTNRGVDYTGATALALIITQAPAAGHAPRFADIVADMHHRRVLGIHIANAEQALLDGSTDTVLTHLELARTTTPTAVEFEDVAAAVRGDIDDIAPTILRRHDGTALMYPGLTHWLMGEPGKGKTWVALHAVAEQLLDGHDVLYLDWEGNRRIIGARFRSLGIPADLVEAHFRYLRPAVLDRTTAAAVVSAASSCTLAIYDGVAKAIARQGLNEDKAPDVLAWLELLVNPISEAGAAGLLLDHVTKEKDGRGLWARGSGAKLGEVSGAAWLVKPREGFSRQRGGRIDLVQAKDREGYIAVDGATVANIGFMPDAATGRLTITVRAPAQPTDGDRKFRPTGIMEKVSRCVERYHADLIEPGVNQIDNDLPGIRREWVTAAIGCLVDEGFITRKPGGGKKVHHAIARPYREADDPLSDRHPSESDNHEERPWDDL